MNSSTFSYFRAFVFSIFSSLITPLKFLISTKEVPFIELDFPQNSSALRNMKCDWSISFIQVAKNRTHPIFQRLHHTNTCTSILYEFANLYS